MLSMRSDFASRLAAATLPIVCGSACFIDDGRTEGGGTSSTQTSSSGSTLSTTSTSTTSDVTSGSEDPTGTTGLETTEAPTSTSESQTADDTITESTTDDDLCDFPLGDCNGDEEDGCETNLTTNPNHCGDCNVVCPGSCFGGQCTNPKIVFVTDATTSGAFSGVAGADEICNQAASNAELPGFYYAWLATAQISPSQRFGKNSGPYILTNEAVIAVNYEDLVDGELLTSISINEFGEPVATSEGCNPPLVWTNVRSNGEHNGADHCVSWMSSFGQIGAVGVPTSTFQAWTEDGCSPQNCSESNRLYCFQQ